MKKVLILLVLILAFGCVFGQTVNGKKVAELKNEFEYVQLVGVGKLLSNKVTIKLDYGQDVPFTNYEELQIKDEDGKKIVFNSTIDAINFMYRNGYEMAQAYAYHVPSLGGGESVYHYLLKRKAN